METYALVSLAIVAGIVSFTSPCCLPLLPGYVSYVSGLAQPFPAPVPAPAGDGVGASTSVAAIPAEGAVRRRVLAGAVLFVLGFSTVFTVLGVSASALGLLLAQNLRALNVVGGTFIIIMGLTMVGVLRIPQLNRRLAIDASRFHRGRAHAFPLGMAFAFGWTPCVGPVLAAILATAATTATMSQGALLLAAYSLGLSVPFLLLAAGLAGGQRRPQWLARNSRRIEVGGGVLLVMMGVALISGDWTILMSRALAFYARLGWPPI